MKHKAPIWNCSNLQPPGPQASLVAKDHGTVLAPFWPKLHRNMTEAEKCPTLQEKLDVQWFMEPNATLNDLKGCN